MNTEILDLETAKKIAQFDKYILFLLKIIERNKDKILLTSNEFYTIEKLKGDYKID